jgi:exodeoxyribonuclease V alpha subunit
MMQDWLAKAVHSGALRAIDAQFATHVAKLNGDFDTPEERLLLLAAALVSQRVGEGDVCVDLARAGDYPLFQVPGIAVPEVRAWAEVLQRLDVVGGPGERAVLILDGRQRLYLARYWHFEHALATGLRARATLPFPMPATSLAAFSAPVPGDPETGLANDPQPRLSIDQQRLQQGLARLFPPGDGTETDWQRVAAAVALLRPLCVISGGPGTGKTRTVTSILALLAEQDPAGRLRIGLAAPTGKAAARLTESIRAAKTELPLSADIAARIPDAAVTLHRLLGFRPGRVNPRHGADYPLHLDLVVVDEASMVDLPLMARLLAAMPRDAHLILLGDKDQLASVEAGMVLGDICGSGPLNRFSPALCVQLQALGAAELSPAPDATVPIADSVVVLEKSWRFDSRSGIGALARAVNNGDADQALTVLAADDQGDVELAPPVSEQLDTLIAERLLPVYRQVLSSADPQAALTAFNRVRLLCAVREGPMGVYRVNQRIEQTLAREGLIDLVTDTYAGRPVMITTNDHAQRLYNGDIGLVLPDDANGGALRVFFATAEGLRSILPSRLPPHETVYAMTVHKSQGSEFADVVLVLPDNDSRVVTRELVYTGISRARERVLLLATPEHLQLAIERRVVRASGLREALWGRG